MPVTAPVAPSGSPLASPPVAQRGRIHLLAGAALALAVLGGCASSPPGDGWPPTQVALERLKQVDPARLGVAYRRAEGLPAARAVLRVEVSETGVVRRAEFIERTGHGARDKALHSWLLAGRFEPWRVDGVAVAVTAIGVFNLPAVAPDQRLRP